METSNVKMNDPNIKRVISTMLSVLLLATLVISSVLFFAPKVHGDEPTDALGVLNSATVVSAQATTQAADQADNQVLLDARSGTLPDTKGSFSTPAPEPVETMAAQSSSIPSGISVPQGLHGGWASKYHITNMWSGVVGSNTVAVLAGSKADDPAAGVWGNPEQGFVLVDVGTSDSPSEYLTPAKNGIIQISSYSGTCLTLATGSTSSGSGTMYHFDVATLHWSCTP